MDVQLLELLKALLVGIVEGVTEWLPISSTGHMILFDEFVRMDVSPRFLEMFRVVIQLGAIMAVVILYFHRLNPFSPRKAPAQRRATLGLWAKVVVACVPAAIVGFLLDDWVEAHVFNAVVVACALVVYGIAFIVIERIKGSGEGPGREEGRAHRANGAGRGEGRRYKGEDHGRYRGRHARPASGGAGAAGGGGGEELASLSFPRALAIGLFQCLAIVPGTSRSGSTILGARILGVSRQVAAEFSFFLAIPVMLGWSLLKVLKVFVLDGLSPTATEWGVLAVGLVAAFAVSVAAIRFLMGYIKGHSFEAFGWYRIVLGILVLAFFALTGSLFG
ncbi:MAG: undecaprenyl-diphosphate phosphatase [Coriobacteriales bacterium]|jgi:undecaprenyl-diphosphatase|nr:undecaprenyl-diphosphate phosphatase [Coriobacteriales bacterium]